MSSLIERIEHVIKARGTNFKRVERECGLGNGTIKRWGEQSPRLDKLALVSEHLQVSLDYLVFGRSCSETSTDGDNLDLEAAKREQGLVCDGSPLNNAEADLIAMFRLLSEEERGLGIWPRKSATVSRRRDRSSLLRNPTRGLYSSLILSAG